MLNKILSLILSFFLFIGLGMSVWADEGQPIDLSSYKGKVVLVDFWASWCGPCRESFPWLNKMHTNKSSEGLVVIGVNVDEDSNDAKQFLEKFPAKFKLIFDPKGNHASYYNIPGMPTTLIFDKQGKLVHQHSGFRKSEISGYEKHINQALAQ